MAKGKPAAKSHIVESIRSLPDKLDLKWVNSPILKGSYAPTFFAPRITRVLNPNRLNERIWLVDSILRLRVGFLILKLGEIIFGARTASVLVRCRRPPSSTLIPPIIRLVTTPEVPSTSTGR